MVSSTVSPWKLQPGHKAEHGRQNDIGGPVCSSVCVFLCACAGEETEKRKKELKTHEEE